MVRPPRQAPRQKTRRKTHRKQPGWLLFILPAIVGTVFAVFLIFIIEEQAGLRRSRDLQQRAAAPAETPAQSPAIGPGSKVLIGWPGNSTTLISGAVDDDTWDAMFKALGAEDKIGITALVITGRILLIKPGTRALVLDSALGRYEVRILSGPYIGRRAWVAREAVALE